MFNIKSLKLAFCNIVIILDSTCIRLDKKFLRLNYYLSFSPVAFGLTLFKKKKKKPSYQRGNVCVKPDLERGGGNTYAVACMHTLTCMHKYMHACTHKYTHNTHTHAHTRTHTHTIKMVRYHMEK